MMQIEVDQKTRAELFPEPLMELLERIHRKFEAERLKLMAARKERQAEFDAGAVPKFLPADSPARNTSWRVAPIPDDLFERRVEITGPISSTKMVINMLSENQEGEIASTAMLDFEDSMAPTWENVLSGVRNLIGVARGDLSYVQGEKRYQLNPQKMAHPMVRVRGLHLLEQNARVDGQAVAAGIFDLAVSAFQSAKLLSKQGKTAKFYVPKCEHHLEARWWNQVFEEIERGLDLQKGSLKVTFLIETLPAAFQMEEILYEIRERATGLNGGRWDKIFSDIKTLRLHKDRILADRGSIDMSRPWMDQYAKLLIKTCHKHGAFAMGGMSAFTPGKDPETRKSQIEKVITDKRREADNGHDGCWVSHPYFIGPAKQQFKKRNQLDVLREDVSPQPDLLPQATGPKTLLGLRQNLRVGIVYQQGWNHGIGCVSFENLMEDLATLEISRAQVWQWLHHQVKLDDGTEVTADLVTQLFQEELDRVVRELELKGSEIADYQLAMQQIRAVFLKKELTEFFAN